MIRFASVRSKSGDPTGLPPSTIVPDEGAEAVDGHGRPDQRHHCVPKGDASLDQLAARHSEDGFGG